MITNKILDRYNMGHLAEVDDEKQFYSAFLRLTDADIVYAFEQLLAGADLAAIKTENAELTKARNFARARLKKLEEAQNEK